jgi:hypothetical protein
VRVAWRATELLLLPTIGLAVVLVVVPGRSELALHVWLLVVLGLALLALVRAVHSTYPRTPSPFAASLQPSRETIERPVSLVRVERELAIGASSAFDVHHRLRPAFTELATSLLSWRRGIDLDADPDAARAVLGDDLWELIEPDRPAPAERAGPGLDERAVERVVTALERI